MRCSVLLLMLGATSVLGFSFYGHHGHHGRKCKRQNAWTSTSTEGTNIVVYDYTVSEDFVTVTASGLPPAEATSSPSSLASSSTAVQAKEKIVLTSSERHRGGRHRNSTYSPAPSITPAVSSSSDTTLISPASSEQPPAASPTSVEATVSATPVPSISIAGGSSSDTSPAVPTPAIPSGQTSGVIATISSLSSPTASIVGENIIGTVCTASVPQLPTAFADTAIAAHNVHRANHSSPDVIWNNDLASAAASWASYCNFSHNLVFGGGGYGQNIIVGPPIENISVGISDWWYNGEIQNFAADYGNPNPPDFSTGGWGHFTQVVWSNTTEVGCATIDCTKCGVYMNFTNNYADGLNFMTVCNYKSPGNVEGQYADNVRKPLGNPTVHGSPIPK